MKIHTFQNIGDGDRIIRVLAGALFIGFTMGIAIDKLGWFSVFPLLAIPLIMTAIIAWDPIYGLFNLSTAGKNPLTTLGFMASNVGRTDKLIRNLFGFGLLLGTLAFVPNTIGVYAMIPLVGAVLILSGIVGWDPLYAVFKLNTLEQLENLPKAVVIKADFVAAKNQSDTEDTGEHKPVEPEPKRVA